MIKNIPALDGLRGIAIALVLIFHWFPTNHWVNVVPNGPIGVTLFFVLSGFLITQILLDKKDKFPFRVNIKNFLARRALRIFPIYYAVLCTIALLFHAHIAINTDFYAHPLPYFLYYYNHLLEQTSNWSDQLSPYWSLAVEEQFYLIWPLLILLIPGKKKILWMIGLLLFLGIGVRYYSIGLHKGIGVYMLTCIDCFAWGGLLAYCKKEQIDLSKWINYLFIPLLIGWIYLCVTTTDADLVKVLFFRTTTSMVGFSLIHFATRRNVFSKIMEFSLLRQLGKISYGVYLYHMVVPQLFFIILQKSHITFPDSTYEIISFFVLIGFSIFSYHLIEKPILRLKRRFE
ncbi:MAG: hypothetical protein RI995_744 [Bacteroidota bacterium]